VDTFLTLVIALGGIATGIGAIWAALAARRQAQLTERSLSEQRQFLKEQNEIARSQAQLTEQSLAQTERSRTEQNERARLNLEVDLLDRMQDHFDSQRFIARRGAVARYLLDNAFVNDRMVEVEHLNEATIDVCDFFENLAYLQRIGALSAKSVWNNFAADVRLHWHLCKRGIEKQREEWQDPTIYEEFEQLSRLIADMSRERGIPEPTPEMLSKMLRQALEEEAVRGEEPPTTTE
jgi:hypothetical protein